MAGDTIYESNTVENGYGLATALGVTAEQTFTPQIAHAIYKVRVKLTRGGSPTGNIFIDIRDASNSILCSSDAMAMSAVTSGGIYTIYTFTFTANPTLQADTLYTIHLTCTGGDESNYIGIHCNYAAATDAYSRGSAYGEPDYTDWYFVECGDLLPPPGLVWTARTLPSIAYWSSIAFGNGMFVAVADFGTHAASSPDGITWTARTLPWWGQWKSVAYGNGMFVAVSHLDGVAATSLDGITWTLHSSGYDWSSITYGNGVFAVVETGSMAAATSSDGITWTVHPLPSTATWSSIAFGNGIFVAVAEGGTVAASSSDGITWTARTLPASENWLSVAFGESIFVAVANASSASASSPDGITWAARTLSSSSAGWSSVTFGGGIFVAIQGNGYQGAASSPDGITWTAGAMPSFGYWQSVAYGGGMFVAVVYDSNIAASAEWALPLPPVTPFTHSLVWPFKFQLTRIP